MDPQQELFTALLVGLKREQFAVYDGLLPPAGTPYPFVYLGDSQLIDEQNKTAVFGNVTQTIHVWINDPRKRGTLSVMMLGIKNFCRRLENTANFGWHVTDITQRIIPDNTTDEPLLHGILDVTFRFS